MTKRAEIERDLQTYAAANYTYLPVAMTHGKGAFLYDSENNSYIDMMSAYSASSFGQQHQGIIETVVNKILNIFVVSRAYMNDEFAAFCKNYSLAADVKLDEKSEAPAKLLPCNGGGEAVETAIKLVRKWGFDNYNDHFFEQNNVRQDQIDPEDKLTYKPIIIYMEGNFHGRTIAESGASGEQDYKTGFGPFPPGSVRVPFDDPEALRKKIKEINNSFDEQTGLQKKVVAVFVEPIQGEAGIHVPNTPNYLKQIAEICREKTGGWDKGALFVADEIQTGMGRTGKLWATQHEKDVQPDVRIIGKAVGGGIYPVSGILARPEVLDSIQPGTHGSTFGGNAIASAIAVKSLDILQEKNVGFFAGKPYRNMVEACALKGEYLMEELAKMRQRLADHPESDQLGLKDYIRDIRGKGLFVGVEINPNEADFHKHKPDIDPVNEVPGRSTGRTICEMLMSKGVVSKETHETTIRLAPPFVINKDQLDFVVQKMEETIIEHARRKALVLAGDAAAKFNIRGELDKTRPMSEQPDKSLKNENGVYQWISQLGHMIGQAMDGLLKTIRPRVMDVS